MAILVYAYFQLSLHQVKVLLMNLETNDYSKGKRCCHPWILNLFESPEKGLFGLLQRLFTKLFLWASLPAILILNASWYLRTHERFLSYVVGSTAVLGTLMVFWFWIKNGLLWRRKSLISSLVRWGFFSMMVAAEFSLFFFFIPYSQNGNIPGKFGQSFLGRPLARLVHVDLSHQKLVTKPDIESQGDFWGDFEKSRLEGADLRKAVLKRADLMGAGLRGAKMEQAVLEEANLKFANLMYANLVCVEAARADFFRAVLRSAFLRDANLQGASFRGAVLLHARMHYADLRGADLSLADMMKASLFHANLQGANIWEANLEESDLMMADLLNANLKNANLQGARFWKAKLQGANLEGAILIGAKDLEIGQLSEVRTLYKAKLDPALLSLVKEKFPHLLESQIEED